MFDPKDKSFDKDSLQTPKYIFDWQNSIYNFDVDICASDKHHFCERYFTKEKSALDYKLMSMHRCAWNNPPYSNIDVFIDLAVKCAKNGMTTVMLIPDFNGEKRFEVIAKHATNITHLTPRVSFIRPDNGKVYIGNNRGSCLVEFSKKYLDTPPTHHYVNLNTVKEKFS